MATFTNQASLSYNNTTTLSNIVTGEIVEVLTAAKNALDADYGLGDTVTYAISIVNSGLTAITGLTITDDLGAYTTSGTTTVTPLTYVSGSANYYANGVLQTAPTVVAGPPLVLSGINIPAGGNAVVLYEAGVNEFAPLGATDVIANRATISGGGINTPIEVTDTISAAVAPQLSISKSISPDTIPENGQLTYTFVIQNTGNTAADAADNAAITDLFNPILENISVTMNGMAMTPNTDYTYSEATGLFQTVPGVITVPAATYTQDPVTGRWTVVPGSTTITVTGTV